MGGNNCGGGGVSVWEKLFTEEEMLKIREKMVFSHDKRAADKYEHTDVDVNFLLQLK